MGGFLSHQTPIKSTQVLDATCGPVRGNIYEPTNGKRVLGYLGIPFAKPPLRFKKAEPADKWVEPLNCYEYGPRCPLNLTIPGMKENHFSENSSEANCLWLSVFTPEWKSEEFPSGRPVMVFVHGGAFEVGSSGDTCDKSLAGSLPVKDIVLVTINYRVGIFGFLTTGDSTCPGNLGLWDQTLALKWVQSHIVSFGGDPNNVTVFGESAGGSSADLLSLSPYSRDLFKRSISMSGTGNCLYSIRSQHHQGSVAFDFARYKGYTGPENSSQVLEWYLSQPADSLQWGIAPLPDFKPEKKGALEFCPVLDYDFFPAPLDDLREQAGPRDVMVGTCEFEGLLFSTLLTGLEPSKALDFAIDSRITKVDYGEQMDEVKAEIKKYFIDNVQKANATNIAAIILMGDDMNTGVIDTAMKSARVGSNVYLYELTHFEKDSFGFMNELFPFQAATHATDLRYVLGEGCYSKFEPSENDLKMHDKMTTWWTNFAKYGNPNGKVDGIWPKYNINRPTDYFMIGLSNSKVKSGYQGNRFQELWSDVRMKNYSFTETNTSKQSIL